MKTQIYLTALLLLFFSSCSENKKVKEETPDATKQVKEHLFYNEVMHPFTSPEEDDKFVLFVDGKNMIEGTINFLIISSGKDTIYKDTFAAKMLLNQDFVFDTTPQEQKEFLNLQLDRFFDEENFSLPAISPGEEYEPDYSDEETWKDIKSDPTAIGFFYLLGEENGKWIAYSKSHDKVVVYYSCC